MCAYYVSASSKIELEEDVMATMETKIRVEGVRCKSEKKLKAQYISTIYTIPRVLPTSICKALAHKIRWPTLNTNMKRIPTLENVWLGSDLKLNATKTCV